MYILLALIAAAAIGVGLHFLLPHRGERGALLTPGAAVATAAAVYSALTWAQWGEDNIWLWGATLVACAAAAAAVTVFVGARRTRRDAEARRRAGIA